MPRHATKKNARQSPRNVKSSGQGYSARLLNGSAVEAAKAAGAGQSLDFGLFGPAPDVDLTEVAELAKELKGPHSSADLPAGNYQPSAFAPGTLYEYMSPPADCHYNYNYMHAELMETKRQVSCLRYSIAEVRPGSAAKLLEDMLSNDTYDLSTFSEHSPQLKPAVPLGFKDLLQPYEASNLYAAMSAADADPYSSPGLPNTYQEDCPPAHFSQPLETGHNAAALDNVTAHTQQATPTEANTELPAEQPMQQPPQLRFVAVRTPGVAAKLALSTAKSQHKKQLQPTPPHTPAMVDVVSQQRKKHSTADMTDAHVVAEDRVRGKKRCRVPGSEDVCAAMHSDKRRRYIDHRTERSTEHTAGVKTEPGTGVHVGQDRTRPKRRRELSGEHDVEHEVVDDGNSRARKRSKAHSPTAEKGPSEAPVGEPSAGRAEAEPLKKDQLVWAKCFNWPYWPARVMELTPEERQERALTEDEIYVEFFDEQKSVTLIKLPSMRGWDDAPKQVVHARGREKLPASIARAKKALKDSAVTV